MGAIIKIKCLKSNTLWDYLERVTGAKQGFREMPCKDKMP